MGVSGIFSLAQLALFAIGGYVSAMLALYLGVTPWLSMFIGALAAVLASVVVGLPTLRLRGVYVVLLTLAFHEILRVLIATDDSGLTGGAFGLLNVPTFGMESLGLRGNMMFHYYFSMLLCFLILFAIHRITYSPIGLAFQSLRDSERYATSRGVSPFRYKMLVFMVSAFFTGLIGAFYAHYYKTISPSAFSFGLLMNLMAMIVLGGWGTFAGPILGTVLLLLLSEGLHSIEQFRLIIFGLMMAVIVVLLPGGLITLVEQATRRLNVWLDEG
jgi:branched-chain amino acid transport system permease protein